LQAEPFARDEIITEPQPSRFTVCYNHSCTDISDISLNNDEWSQIQSIFNPRAKTPEHERKLIAKAVATMETIVGKYIDTSNDIGKNFRGIFKGTGNQMDCIDESTNTRNYIYMLSSAGLITWHQLEDRSTRYPSILSWPHTTAVIKDKQSERLYAVDSWFEKNGELPHIIPLEQWKKGWEPRAVN